MSRAPRYVCFFFFFHINLTNNYLNTRLRVRPKRWPSPPPNRPPPTPRGAAAAATEAGPRQQTRITPPSNAATAGGAAMTMMGSRDVYVSSTQYLVAAPPTGWQRQRHAPGFFSSFFLYLLSLQ